MKNLIIVLGIMFLVLGCGNSTKVKTGSTTATNEAPATLSNQSRRVTVNQTKTFNGLDITIGEIALEPGKITVGMTISNKSKETMTCYPNQGHLVIGKNQLKANMFMDSGDLDGEIHAGVEKQGSIAFLDTDNIVEMSTVQALDLRLGTVYGKNFMKSVEIIWPVGIK